MNLVTRNNGDIPNVSAAISFQILGKDVLVEYPGSYWFIIKNFSIDKLYNNSNYKAEWGSWPE